MFTVLWSLCGWLCTLLLNTGLEILLYVPIDVVVKSSIKEANNDLEKRSIWLSESAVLFVLAAVVYLTHHLPLLLLLLAVSTLIYTQLFGRINFRYWWHQLITRWDEFEQHEESMEEYHSRQQAVPTAAVGGMLPNVPGFNRPPLNWMPPTATMGLVPGPVPMEQTQGDAQCEPWYYTPNVDLSHQNIPGGGQRNTPPGPPPIRYRNQMMTGHPTVGPDGTFQMGPSYSPVMPRGPELVRRPLHPMQRQRQRDKENTVANTGPQLVSISSRIKSSVLSALGVATIPQDIPPGLKNAGQNICFMNSVLQCLAHSPMLAECLAHSSAQSHYATKSQENLCKSLAALWKNMRHKSGVAKVQALDLSEVRKNASNFPGSMIIDPHSIGRQSQQDSAEFLTWLLNNLHQSLNGQQPGSMSAVLSSSLQSLQYLYGDMPPKRMQELKAECKQQISQAHGLDNKTYAEPIQRLADLEWLDYKSRNRSVVDDMFTGQMVEALHCLVCNHMSVSTPTFNILPVPIVEARQLNGLVPLEDCFHKFCRIEELVGPNGLQCENCSHNRQHLQQFKTRPATHFQTTSLVGGGALSQENQLNKLLLTPQERATPTKDLRTAFQDATSPVLANGGHGQSPSASIPSQNWQQRRRLSSADSAFHSMVQHPGAMAMSPIPHMTRETLSDSGYQESASASSQYKTSTPIRDTVVGNDLVTSPISPTLGGPYLSDCQRRALLRQLPECLVLQLLRFSMQGSQPHKLCRPVSIPLVNLDLTSLSIDNVLMAGNDCITGGMKPLHYNLYGLCLHVGGSQNPSVGHYIAYTQASNGNWYKFDDEVVTPVNIQYELNTRQVRENAYLLFYKQTLSS